MKTLIVYATKSGASRACAELLAAKIEDCFVCDLAAQAPNLANFETVILGSGVRMGKIYRPMKRFLAHNAQALLLKRTAFFLCNAYADTFQKVVETNIPKALRDSAVSVESFGGIPPFTSPKRRDWVLSGPVEQMVQAVLSKE